MPAIYPLARFIPEMAVELALSLNVASRRDRALVEFFEASVRRPFDKIDFEILLSTLDKFDDEVARDHSLSRLLANLENAKSTSPVPPSPFLSILQRLGDVGSVEVRVLAQSRAYKILMANWPASHSSLASSLLDAAELGLPNENQGWQRVDLGFRISAIVAKNDRDKAGRKSLTA